MSSSHDAPISDRPLTIVQVASCFSHWGGMEIHLLNLGDQLRRRGHRVIVAARPGGYVMTKAQSLGLETFAATVQKQLDWTDFGRYRRFFRDERVDVAHVHSNWDLLVPTLAARVSGVPVAVTTWHLPKGFRTQSGGRALLRLYDRMIAVSESVRQTHLRLGVPPDKVQTIHHGTDVRAFQATTRSRDSVRAEFGLGSEHVAVGIVGRVSPEKGHRDLFYALHRLAPDFPALRLVVIGDGLDDVPLRALAATLGLSDKIVFAGFRDDVNNALAALDIVAVPSVWNEPCCAVVQQAMALGKPVVGTCVGGTPEMIVDGETGILVPPHDADALAQALARLASDAGLRANMGAAGKTRVGERFTLDSMTDKVLALYRRERVKGRRVNVS